MDLQRIGIKFFAELPAPVDLSRFIPLFHRWIQTAAVEGLLIDVADYSHVPDGPGIMLIAHEGHYAIDSTGGRVGLLYDRKRHLDGDPAAGLGAACRVALRACQQLESAEELKGSMRFPGDELQIIANDRLAAPNTDQTMAAFQPLLRPLLGTLYGDGKWEISRPEDRRERFSVTVKAAAPVAVSTLLERLAGAPR